MSITKETTTMTTEDYCLALNKLGACSDAVYWSKDQPDAQAAWDNCERPDWMFWLIGRDKNLDRKKLGLCVCEIARQSLKYVKAGEDRPRVCIETTERYCRGEATIKEVRQARACATDAYADAADATDAANAAAYAAYAAKDAANAAANAAKDAAKDDYAAAYAAAAAAMQKSKAESAAIIRKHYPTNPIFALEIK